MPEKLIRALEERRWIDRAALPAQRPVRRALARSPRRLRNVLHGTFLQHPLHAALTDVPVGAWTAGLVLDALDVVAGRRGVRAAADAVHTVGLVGALCAAVTGLADWGETDGPARRVGFLHGVTNGLVAGLFGASLLARRRGRRGAGVALSSTGFGLLLFSAWLGGELAYRHGVGVRHVAPDDEAARGWTPVLEAARLGEGELRQVHVGDTPVVLARLDGRVHALGDTCTHLGCPLSAGFVEGDRVVCRCHGSEFRLTDGGVVRGPATFAAPRFEVRLKDGQIELRAPRSSRPDGDGLLEERSAPRTPLGT